MEKGKGKKGLIAFLSLWALVAAGCVEIPSEKDGEEEGDKEVSTLTAGGTTEAALQAMESNVNAMGGGAALIKSSRLRHLDEPDDDLYFECELIDSEGNTLHLDDPEADFPDIAEVYCEGPCNEDGSGSLASWLSFTEEGDFVFDLAFDECQVDACGEAAGTISGNGLAVLTADCEATWEMEIVTSDGNEILFDLTADASTEIPGECAEIDCESFEGSVTVNGEEIPMEEVCAVADESTDACGTDEVDEE